jgi:hypothetical protein
MDVLFVFPQMFSQLFDVFRKHGDLDFGRAGVLAVDLVFLDNPRFGLSV